MYVRTLTRKLKKGNGTVEKSQKRRRLLQYLGQRDELLKRKTCYELQG